MISAFWNVAGFWAILFLGAGMAALAFIGIVWILAMIVLATSKLCLLLKATFAMLFPKAG